MTPLSVQDIRPCLEGAIPAAIATCAADGTPNVTYISQVHYVDPDHVALTYQFFNKTRRNLMETPVAVLQLIDPQSAEAFRLTIRYVRTETGGPLFESMKAKLAGIASHTGMAGTFRLLGADICRVLKVEAVPGRPLPVRRGTASLLPALRRAVEAVAGAEELGGALDRAMSVLGGEFGIGHAAVLLLDPARDVLYTVASRGYDASGIGSEIPLGHGVIGTAAREGCPIRISHMTSEYSYARTLRRQAGAEEVETEIPLPGLKDPGSQLALPMADAAGLLGVLFVESEADLRFGYDHEDALAVFAAQIGATIRRLDVAAPQPPAERPPAVPPGEPAGPAIEVRHYKVNDSVFLDEDYLIKGVAGAIFWKLVCDHAESGRTEFTNRELRLDPALRLPEHAENLEARLILLERRLAEKCAGLRMEKTGRGRFRLRIDRPVRLHEMQG